MIGPASAYRIVEILRWLNDQLGPDRQAIVRTMLGDPMVDWRSFPEEPSCRLPGIPVGQIVDVRYSTDRDDGLHVHVFADRRVEFHVDLIDGCGQPIAHGLGETEIVKGTLVGLAIGGLAAILTGNARVALAFMSVGAAGGAAIGAQIPRRTPIYYELSELLAVRTH